MARIFILKPHVIDQEPLLRSGPFAGPRHIREILKVVDVKNRTIRLPEGLKEPRQDEDGITGTGKIAGRK